MAEAVETQMSRDECDEHCDEYHGIDPELESRRDQLDAALRRLVEEYHGLHDRRFPWSLCAHELCRETAIALDLRP